MNIKCWIVILMLTLNRRITCFDQFNSSDIAINNNTVYSVSSHRKSKFLFDTIFRISTGVSNAFGFESDDEAENIENSNVATCDCGKFAKFSFCKEPRIKRSICIYKLM